MSNRYGFATKAYTIQSLINEVSSLKPSQFKSKYVLASALSPRLRTTSAKFTFLTSYVGGDITNVLNGTGRFSTLGKTARTRILTALRNRQNF